ncbi:MAG: hypothetical protein M0P01_03140 [Treponema sp.]|nr:hypothetical protein [Treponema sp.]
MSFRVLIMRLSQFRDVVKSTTHQFLYGECARVLSDECIDFAFLPAESARRRHCVLEGFRTHIPAADFDLILVVNSYAVELINLPYMLKIAGIPYSSDERREKNAKPLIIMGGSNAMASQAMLFNENEALTDAVYFGEGEENVTAVVKALSEVSDRERRSTLVSLQDTITGLRVFGAPHKTISKAVFSGTNVEQLANAKQALFDSAEAGIVRLMISYDCPSFCTFCFEGWERKPYREVPFSELLKAAKHLKRETGASTLEITAFNFNTHTDVTRIITEMNKLFAQVNFMSQRADILASSSMLASYEITTGKRQFTLGAEGISERMRTYFNKNLNEETLLKSMGLLMSQNAVKEIKLFYIIAGIETDEDFEDFRCFLSKAAELKTQFGSPARILCSFGLLVRMPFTPLRYEKLLLTKKEWEPVVENIKQTVESAGYEFRLTYPYEEYFLSQVLVLTNYYAAPALIDFAGQDIVYDRTLPDGAWNLFVKHVPVTPEFTAEKGADYKFAYSGIDTRTTADFLYARFLDAKNGREMKSCMSGECRGCGSCTQNQRNFLLEHKITMPSASDKADVNALLLEKQRAKPVYIKTEIPETMAHNRTETKNAFIMRKLMDAVERTGTETESLIMKTEDVLFGSDRYAGRLPHWYGTTLYAVYPFSDNTRSVLSAALKNAGIQADNTEEIPAEYKITLIPDIQTENTELEKTAQSLLNSMHLPYMLSRKSGYTNLVIAPKALKKHIVNSCAIHDGKIFVICSIKADFGILAKERFHVHTETV